MVKEHLLLKLHLRVFVCVRTCPRVVGWVGVIVHSLSRSLSLSDSLSVSLSLSLFVFPFRWFTWVGIGRGRRIDGENDPIVLSL